jgi:hypothetical protein
MPSLKVRKTLYKLVEKQEIKNCFFFDITIIPGVLGIKIKMALPLFSPCYNRTGIKGGKSAAMKA